MRSRIHRKGRRNKPLREREKQGNKTRSSVRVRVEHVFGAQSNDMGGTLVRSVGLVRAKARIGLKNLAYNMRGFDAVIGNPPWDRMKLQQVEWFATRPAKEIRHVSMHCLRDDYDSLALRSWPGAVAILAASSRRSTVIGRITSRYLPRT